ncbi:hypothetical protein SAMN06296056_1011010 [Priestia filamentosa]|nr:hypothetical protein SAMN06296056_1011010 [Priestia filamentosa]
MDYTMKILLPRNAGVHVHELLYGHQLDEGSLFQVQYKLLLKLQRVLPKAYEGSALEGAQVLLLSFLCK